MFMRHNKSMSEKELNAIVANEIEWRKMLWKKVEQVEKNQHTIDKDLTGLRVKVAFWGGLFGTMGGTLISYITKNHL